MKRYKYLAVISAVLTAFIIFPKNGYCYIDPGSGSFIMQLIIGALVGMLFTLKLFLVRIKGFFKHILSLVKKVVRKRGEK